MGYEGQIAGTVTIVGHDGDGLGAYVAKPDVEQVDDTEAELKRLVTA
jgi:hypothetical protein